MKCPKCGKQLKLIHLRAGDFYSHSYTVAHAMSNKIMCDYSRKIRGS